MIFDVEKIKYKKGNYVYFDYLTSIPLNFVLSKSKGEKYNMILFLVYHIIFGFLMISDPEIF